MRRRTTRQLSSRAKSQIRDFIDDEKSFGRTTKGQIAAAIGIRPSHFSNLLNGRNEWKLNQLEKLADCLGVPIAQLFEERRKDAGPDASREDRKRFSEDRIVRAVRVESQSLRSGLRADLGELLREHASSSRAASPVEYRTGDAVMDLAGALPVEVHDPETLYDASPPETASDSLWPGRGWFRRHGIDSVQCMLIRVEGTSMEQTLPDGCIVLVNRGQRQRRAGRIYALRTEDGILLGRAGRDGAGGWLLESDHPDRKPVPWPEGAEIIGQVRWMARTL